MTATAEANDDDAEMDGAEEEDYSDDESEMTHYSDEDEDAYGHASPDRIPVGLPERYRRLSQPTAPPAGIVGGYA